MCIAVIICITYANKTILETKQQEHQVLLEQYDKIVEQSENAIYYKIPCDFKECGKNSSTNLETILQDSEFPKELRKDTQDLINKYELSDWYAIEYGIDYVNIIDMSTTMEIVEIPGLEFEKNFILVNNATNDISEDGKVKLYNAYGIVKTAQESSFKPTEIHIQMYIKNILVAMYWIISTIMLIIFNKMLNYIPIKTKK